MLYLRGLECYSWAGLTTEPPDEPMEEAADDDIVFGSDEIRLNSHISFTPLSPLHVAI